MSIMATDVDTSEDRIVEIEKKINMLMKVVEERDYEITSLKNYIESRDAAESSHKHTINNDDKGKFVRSLKENSFGWYTDLEPESIYSWEQLQRDFLNCFYSTRHIVSMMELTNIRQPKEKQVIDYINRWRALSLDYMLEQLLENQLIQLPKCKRPKQARKVDDPNYCKYHRVISHPVEKCFLLKEMILKLAREKKIELDIYEVAQTNHVAVEMTLSVPPSTHFLNDHLEEVSEVTACHAVGIVEVDNNYASSEEVDNSNEVKQRTYVFDRIKPSITRSSIFQRWSMATKEEKNQCPMSTSTQTSAFKRLSISTSKRDRPLTSDFDRLKMTNDQQQREMKTLKAKPFHEENNDNKINNRVPSHMKRKLVDINTEVGSIDIFIFSHVLQLGGSTPSFSHMCCIQEDLHLHLLTRDDLHLHFQCGAAETIIIFIDHYLHLQDGAAKTIIISIFDVVTVKTIIISIFNVAQPRRSSSPSSTWCNRDDHHPHLEDGG
ncbi:Retrotransposon gag protein [Cucumis melo var. makuwa]|uniref:Retrotransposon gag protein n=1 Tax=Cucumis melo var. makuwa TaxID=1194695 RepID=A0A5D3CTF5_CUCMM|nr:Retrotransposon gag protein [Cucumis melo var. makuwa]